jgi:trimethylamine:corrinoid methyltransferase-like protein
MQPRISLLTDELIERILQEAFELMLRPGIKVQSSRALDLLEAGGAIVDR